MENSAASGATPHELDRAGRGWFAGEKRTSASSGIEQGQIDLIPGVLIAADNNAGAIDVEEENGTVCRALSQNVVLDGEIEKRIMAARRVALQLVRRVDELVREA